MAYTLSIPEDVHDRLKTFGHAGMSCAEILTHLMDRVQRDDFVSGLHHQYDATPRRDYVDLEDL